VSERIREFLPTYPENPPGVVQWYRPTPHRRLLRQWAVGATLVTIGVFTVGLSLSNLLDLATPARVVLALVGMAATISGPTLTTVGSVRIMSEETYLLLRTDGVELASDQERWFVPWSEVDEVRWDAAAHAVVLARGDEERHVSGAFHGVDGPRLASEMTLVRRRALMGLL
jgi:hypothetical protein